MFLAHSFRLRDPWQCECGAEGSIRWSRVFHRPTGLEDDDALWLVCSLLPAGAVVSINGQRLTPCATGVPPVLPAHQYEVTTFLAEANRIEIQIPSSSDLQPPASSLQPAVTFPYDVRLGVVGHS
jgi:hypothetical protein